MAEEDKFSLEVLQKALSIAGEAKLEAKLELEYTHVFIDVCLGDRSQGVIVRDKTVNHNMPVIGIFSPCMRFERADIVDKLPDISYKLLRANERINLANYALMENEKEVIIIASCESLLGEITPQAFKANVMAVALAADLFAEKLGRDVI